MTSCSWCHLTEKEKQWLLFHNDAWSVYFADEQDYIGRCILVLNRHCESLAELDAQEWHSLKAVIDILEHCMKTVLGADLCNWSCLMNSFYKAEKATPHLHIHVRPRYKEGIEINGHSYRDEEYGHHYSAKKETLLTQEDRITLFRMMKAHLSERV